MKTAKNIVEHQKKVAYWQPLLSQWQASGLSIAAFCEQRQLSPPQFYYWKKCLSKKTAKPPSVSWMPVKLANVAEGSIAPVVVRLPRAVSIELRGSVAVETWRHLFAALEVTSC